MKYLATILGFVLFSSTVFGADHASHSERSFLCAAVDKMLDVTSADTALDMKRCLAQTNLTSILETEGTRTVRGTLTFRAPFRPNYRMNCFATYFGQPKLENITEGIESVICE